MVVGDFVFLYWLQCPILPEPLLRVSEAPGEIRQALIHSLVFGGILSVVT